MRAKNHQDDAANRVGTPLEIKISFVMLVTRSHNSQHLVVLWKDITALLHNGADSKPNTIMHVPNIF